jgi:hypothetical protein
VSRKRLQSLDRFSQRQHRRRAEANDGLITVSQVDQLEQRLARLCAGFNEKFK